MDTESGRTRKHRAQHNLGNIYHYGQGLARDHREAARWYRAAADKGHAIAQYNLGVMYHQGHGVAQDEKEAARWYQKAAGQGDIMASWRSPISVACTSMATELCRITRRRRGGTGQRQTKETPVHNKT